VIGKKSSRQHVRSKAVGQPAAPSLTPQELKQLIERRAYECYEKRGSRHGLDLEDWLCAEAEVLGHAEKAKGDKNHRQRARRQLTANIE